MNEDKKIEFQNSVAEINENFNGLVLAIKGLKNHEYVVAQGNTEDSRLLMDQLVVAQHSAETAFGYLFAVGKNLE